jgi:Lon protease-like protein
MMHMLPDTIPIFPLSGTILLPGQLLPLHLFEDRYVAMGRYAHANALPIGMIQPMEAEGDLFDVGCAGKIVEYQETNDGRIELILQGTTRFTVTEELSMHDGGFRLIIPDNRDYAALDDAAHATETEAIPASAVLFATKRLMDSLGVQLNAQGIEDISGADLVDTLCVMLPFPPEDKQALLQAETVQDRFALMQQFVQAYTSADSHSYAVH